MKLRHRFRHIALGALALGEAVCLLGLNPQRVPSIVLVAPFIILFALLYIGTLQIVGFARGDDTGRIVGMALRRPRVLAAFIAGFPVMLLVLQSIGQLTVRDFLAACAIFVISYIYITRSSVSLLNFKNR